MEKGELRLYNTLTRRIETFRPFDPQKVKIYTCGPTVYSSPHVGNFAAYVYWDLLIRVLKMNEYVPYRVLNLTDVGHLVSDGDDGEDKLEKGARKTGKSVWEVAEYYIKEFQKDFASLNLVQPQVWARATDYIAEDERLVDQLTAKGFTYETNDGVYYDTSKFKKYADFAKLDLEGQWCGGSQRVECDYTDKRNPADFAVWKFIQPGEKHAMRWDYLGRPGYPGWHLECSSIIHAELGETIDIHTGGIDHIPVHHTDEIAQSEAIFDKELAKYWLHCNHLTVDGEKISKSLGNGYTLNELAERGYSPLDYKMWVLQGHYQSERDFSIENLEAARVRRLSWRNRVARCYQGQNDEIDQEVMTDLRLAFNDNLNSPKAFAIIDSCHQDNLEFWQWIDGLLGLGLVENSKLPEEVTKTLQARAQARSEKNYDESDRLRDALAEYGYTVSDTKDGQIWQYLK